jgi:hypothetical protein
MKRVLLIALVLILVIGGTSFAAGRPKTFGLTAIGAYGSWGFVGNMGGGGIGLSFKFASFPVVGLKYDFGREYASFGASVDWYILDSLGLVDAMTYFVGVGGFFSIASGGGNYFNLGLRGNFGLQFWPVRLVELYIDLIPALTFFDAERFTPGFGLGLEAGLRFHF